MHSDAGPIARLLCPRWRILWWSGLWWLIGRGAAGMLSVQDLATAVVWTSLAGWGMHLQMCTASTSAPAGINEASDCVCARGLTGSPSVVLGTGTYKDSLGAGACTVCVWRSRCLRHAGVSVRGRVLQVKSDWVVQAVCSRHIQAPRGRRGLGAVFGGQHEPGGLNTFQSVRV